MKKQTTFFFTLLFWLTTSLLYSQNIVSISGKVVNDANEPFFGNVVALSVLDSAFIKGVSFADTTFLLGDINRPSVLLKFSSLLFKDTIFRVNYDGKTHIDIGTIKLRQQNNELAAVTVVAKTPLITHNSNGTIEVNVAKTVLSASSSVSEILTKSPNIVDNNGQLSVLGKGEALIFLNGRQITNERLASIPVSQILKIEIIANPSSKYDAEGRAVINIITKLKGERGIMGTASQQVTYSDFAGTNAQTLLDLSYVKNKLSVVGNYSALFGKTREFLYTTRTRPAETDYLQSELTTDWRRKMNNYSNYGVGFQYNFDQKTNISMAYSGFSENLGGFTQNKNSLITKLDNSFYASIIGKDEVRTNNSLTVNYNKTLDSLGSSLFIGTQYSHFGADIDDFINENRTINGIDGNRNLKNTVAQGITVSSTQSDFTRILGGGKKLEFGAKFSYANTESATDFLISENRNPFVLDRTLSNTFQYVEAVSAGYLSYGGVFHKINFGAGVRAEWTDYRLNTSVGGGQIISDRYLNVFPNLQFNTMVAKTLKLRAAYVSRITRPRYQALNPYVIYQDPFTTIEGNPNLIPEKTHAFEIGLNRAQYDFRVGYNFTIDPIERGALRGANPNSYILKVFNIDQTHSYFAALTHSVNLKWWASTNTVNLSYTNSIANNFDFVFVQPTPQLYLYSSNTFTLKNIAKIQLLAWYLGRKKYGLFDDYDRYMVMLGIEKDFFHNKLKLRLIANDIFRRTNASGFYSVGKTDIYYNRSFNNGYFRCVATWNFGQIKKSNYKIKSTGQSENNRAN